MMTQTGSDTKRLQAKCLCGSVRLSAIPADGQTSVCHCDMCKRWSAGPFFGVHCADSMVVEAGDDLERYNSSEWAERGFCRKCGTSLFWNLQGKSDYHVSLMAFDPMPDLAFSTEIFIDQKPNFTALPMRLKN